ncbi:unnamed protein product [Lampetra fluviatilis]
MTTTTTRRASGRVNLATAAPAPVSNGHRDSDLKRRAEGGIAGHVDEQQVTRDGHNRGVGDGGGCSERASCRPRERGRGVGASGRWEARRPGLVGGGVGGLGEGGAGAGGGGGESVEGVWRGVYLHPHPPPEIPSTPSIEECSECDAESEIRVFTTAIKDHSDTGRRTWPPSATDGAAVRQGWGAEKRSCPGGTAASSITQGSRGGVLEPLGSSEQSAGLLWRAMSAAMKLRRCANGSSSSNTAP